MKLENMTAGMTLWDQRRVKRGCHAELATWVVRVLEIDLVKRQVRVSWNNNPARWVSERHVTRYRKNLKEKTV